MYEAFFDLRSRPFAGTPNTGEYYPAASHEDCLALLQCFVSDDEGIALLLGPPGIGKTLLGHRLLDQLKPQHQPILLSNTHSPSVAALLQAILYDLSLPFEAGGEQELRLRLTDVLLDRFAAGDRTLLIVDEAQHLSVDQLEELRLLTNLESRQRKALQVVLLSQPSLEAVLEKTELDGFRQRVSVVGRLTAFEAEETVDYIHAAVERVGGASDSIFTANALAEVCERSGGVPRRINQLCHRALLLAFAHQSGTVDSPFVEAAAEQLLMPKTRRPHPSHHLETVLETPVAAPTPIEEVETDAADAHVVEVGADYPIPDRPEAASAPPAVETPSVPFPTRVDAPISRQRRLYSR